VTENLYFLELGMDEVKQMWEGKFGRDVYQVFSAFVDIGYPEFVDFMASMLPGLAEEFIVDYVRELADAAAYDAIVWDTAPLGQTLALLGTPAMLIRHLKMAPRIYARFTAGTATRESILDIIRRWEALSAADMDFLRTRVQFNLVCIPEALAVNQLDYILSELKSGGFTLSRLIVNNVVKNPDSTFLLEKSAEQAEYLDTIGKRYGYMEITRLPLFSNQVKGLDKLSEAAGLLYSNVV
jgi:arsenite-transporting ATPase